MPLIRLSMINGDHHSLLADAPMMHPFMHKKKKAATHQITFAINKARDDDHARARARGMRSPRRGPYSARGDVQEFGRPEDAGRGCIPDPVARSKRTSGSVVPCSLGAPIRSEEVSLRRNAANERTDGPAMRFPRMQLRAALRTRSGKTCALHARE